MSAHQLDDEDVEVTVHPQTWNPTHLWDTMKNRASTVCRVVQPMEPGTPKPEGSVRFVCISDTHNQVASMSTIPDGDVLIHAGDFTSVGRLTAVETFNQLLGQLPHRHKIVIAGNHELTFDRELTKLNKTVKVQEEWKDISSLLTNCTYLEDEEVNVLGFRIYGSPWQPEFCDWAFNLPRGQPLLDKWNLIPAGIDILITHGPPLGHGDLTTDNGRAGCVELLATVQRRVKPKYHIFGHIHEGYGITTDDTTTFINASICTALYCPSNPPIVFDLPARTAGPDTEAEAP